MSGLMLEIETCWIGVKGLRVFSWKWFREYLRLLCCFRGCRLVVEPLIMRVRGAFPVGLFFDQEKEPQKTPYEEHIQTFVQRQGHGRRGRVHRRLPVARRAGVFCQIEAVQNGASIQSEKAAGFSPIERKARRHCLFFYPIRAWVRLYDSPSNLIILPWCTVLSTIAVAMSGSPNTRPQPPDSMFVV